MHGKGSVSIKRLDPPIPCCPVVPLYDEVIISASRAGFVNGNNLAVCDCPIAAFGGNRQLNSSVVCQLPTAICAAECGGRDKSAKSYGKKLPHALNRVNAQTITTGIRNPVSSWADCVSVSIFESVPRFKRTGERIETTRAAITCGGPSSRGRSRCRTQPHR